VPTEGDVVSIFRDITERSVMVLDAIEARRVVPFFQPILDIASRKIVAYEVLSRIEVNGEIIRADQFVEIAEKIGVIHRLDMLVIEQALTILARRVIPAKSSSICRGRWFQRIRPRLPAAHHRSQRHSAENIVLKSPSAIPSRISPCSNA
jgi:hypothetical protein